MSLSGLFNKARISIRERLNPLLGPFRRVFLKNSSFTIISNNCWGGHVYRFFDLPYYSPTIGLYFFTEEYIRFISNLNYYLSLDLSFISFQESKYREYLVSRKETEVPIGILGDVEIVFLHYKTPEEAKEKWNRRKERINWNHMIIKMSEMNLCSNEHLSIFDQLPYKNKILFTTHDSSYSSAIVFKEYKNQAEIKNDTLNFRRYVNLFRIINES